MWWGPDWGTRAVGVQELPVRAEENTHEVVDARSLGLVKYWWWLCPEEVSLSRWGEGRCVGRTFTEVVFPKITQVFLPHCLWPW